MDFDQYCKLKKVSKGMKTMKKILDRFEDIQREKYRIK